MTKLEQDFEIWWEREGQEFLYALNTTTDDDIKLVAEIAWKNGAYCAEQAEQEPVGEMIDKTGYKGAAWYLEPPATGTKLYAAPVRTKDLTDDEIREIFANRDFYATDDEIEDARAVIAADREKNK